METIAHDLESPAFSICLRVFIPLAGAIGILIGLGHGPVRECLQHDLCQIEKATLPDEPAEHANNATGIMPVITRTVSSSNVTLGDKLRE